MASEQACDVACAKPLRHVLARGDVPPPVRDQATEALAPPPPNG